MTQTPTFVRGARRVASDPAPSPAPGGGRRGVRPAARAGRVRDAVAAARRGAAGAGGRVTALVAPLAPVVAAVRRRLAPVLGSVSPLGWIVVGGAVGLGLLGLDRGWLELRTLALMLAVVAAVAVLFTLGRWEYAAVLELGSNRVRIGDTALGRVALRNAGRRPAASTRIDLPVGRNVAPFRVPRLAPGAEHEEVFQVPARRRGVITLGPVRSVRTDPLGLIHRQRTWTDAVELFVHPDTVRLDTQAVGFLKDVEGVATQNLTSSDVSFHALRDYVPGDDRRSIHWRTTARVGRLMVRQFEETRRSHLLLLLSLNPDDYASGDDFELAVSVLGSLGLAAIREERQLSVCTSDGLLEFPSGPGLLDALARVELRPTAVRLKEAAATAAARVPGASVVGIVVGGVVPPAALRSAQLMLPAEATTFALRCDRDAPAARRKASRLLVLDIPTLDDLQRGLRTLR